MRSDGQSGPKMSVYTSQYHLRHEFSKFSDALFLIGFFAFSELVDFYVATC